MSQKTILPFLLCFCLSIQVFAQVNPQFCRVEGAAIAYTPPPPSSTTNDGPYTIKVYVHMCLPTSAIGSNAPEDHHGISATELNAIIATTEEDFEPHNIFFDWCVLYHYSDEDFITSEQYPYTNFIGSYSLNDGINAYILPDNYFDNEGGYSSSSAGGGSSFALANQSALPATNLVIYGQVYECYPAFYPAYDGDHFATIPHVLSHEMGHCLGLFHTHETVTCAELPDGSNSSTCGDLITDTPADPNLRFSVNTSCQWVSHFFPPACTAGPPGYNYIPTPGYSPDLLNIMAYTNYYACKPVFTAGQGVRMRNTIANSPVLANITHTVFPGNITITGSETWPSVAFPYTGNVILQGSVTIEPGATLTINSGTIHFPESGQVIIKPGGLLVLKATLTSNCSIWKGVTVQGTAGIAQSTTTQGKLLALSGSSIEHAATGVSASNGGIVDCTGTLFKNNRHGAWINPHSFSQELTRFSQCRFTNDYYNRFSNSSFFLQPISHLVLSNVKASSDAERIKIAGCEFHTAFPGPNLNPAIVGILSLQSDFKVTALFTPSGNIRSHFENLNFGILAKFSANIGGSVSNSDFKSCNVGIHALGQRSFSVNGNNFEMGELPAELPFYSYPQYPEQIGVWYKGNMPQLFLVGNNFKKTGTSNTIETIGSLAEGLGSYNHVFLLNDYEGITYANLANGSNASASGQRGLHYLCNTNLPPQRYDFAVEALATIRSEQGQAAGGGAGVFLSATNTFSYTNGLNGDYSDFLNEGGSAVNYYYNTAINEEPLDYLGIFKVFTPATSPCASLAVCPEPCKTETEINAIKADYYAEAALYENAEQGHAQAILNNNAALAATEATTMAVHRDRMDYNIGMVLLHERYGSNRPDSIRKWTAAFDRAAAELHIALSYFDEQNYTAADAVLQLIPQRYSLTTRETAEVNALRDMVALLDDKNLSDLDATTIATLVPIAADDVLGLATTWARSILIPYGYWYRPTYRLPDGIGERSNSQEQIPPTAKQKSVVIYPNPAGNQLDIRLSAPELGQIQVKVFSSLGRLLDHQQTEAGAFTISLDVAHLPSGVYIVQVSDSSRILTTEKIIIQH